MNLQKKKLNSIQVNRDIHFGGAQPKTRWKNFKAKWSNFWFSNNYLQEFMGHLREVQNSKYGTFYFKGMEESWKPELRECKFVA